MARLNRVGASLIPLILVGIAGAAAPAAAQSTGILQGTITDSQNAIMPGVSITIHNSATGLDRTAVTDSAGEYVASALQPGHYQITAHIEGFADQKGEADLLPAQTTVLNFKLGVATVQEAVTVAGDSPIIETATVSVGQVMREKTVQEIPLNGRH